MAKRKIIKINEEKCNGCGMCIPNCPEGAIQIIDNKARLVSDLFCDGLGACLGHCPQGAITIEEREAEEYNEEKVIAGIAKQGRGVIKAHLEHLKEHNQDAYLYQAMAYLEKEGIENPLKGHKEENLPPSHGHNPTGAKPGMHVFSGCPGSRVIDFGKKEAVSAKKKPVLKPEPQLRQWPVQIMLVPAYAPYLQNADLLIAADCVPFAYADFHQGLLKDKTLLVGCPKLDDLGVYREKISQIIKNNNIKSVTYAHMEVPCCFGLISIIKSAIAESRKDIPFKESIISIKGEILG